MRLGLSHSNDHCLESCLQPYLARLVLHVWPQAFPHNSVGEKIQPQLNSRRSKSELLMKRPAGPMIVL